MTKIDVYDSAMCCSTGVCGVDVDQRLVNFAEDVEWAKQQGMTIERFNLGQRPLEFANNNRVKGLLQRSGEASLPLILVDGEVALAGRYPSRIELTRLAGVAASPTPSKTESSCCGGSC